MTIAFEDAHTTIRRQRRQFIPGVTDKITHND
jgi:hypothetical protein